MRIAVTGSIATDHLMVFPGRFADQLLPGQLAHLSLSFLVDGLAVCPGGAAANAAFGLGRLGLSPLLVGAAGPDFAAHAARLEEHGVDTRGIRISPRHPTARFSCVTDRDAHRIASFHPGAMAEARGIDLRALCTAGGRPGLVLITADDPAAMLRHTAACRGLGIPFAAAPARQLAHLTGPQIRDLVDGAAWLFTSEREAALLCGRTGWSRRDVLAAAGTWVTTPGVPGAGGVRVERLGRPPLSVPAARSRPAVDATGAQDAFRAGFLAAAARRVPLRSAARLGCVLAAAARDTRGAQSHQAGPARLADLIGHAYGPRAATALAPVLGAMPAPTTVEAARDRAA